MYIYGAANNRLIDEYGRRTSNFAKNNRKKKINVDGAVFFTRII